MSINSNKIPHIIAVAIIYTYSFLKCARLYLSYGTNFLFALLCFACHFLILAAISLTILHVYQWTKKKYNYFVLNWPSNKRGIQYQGTNCLLIDSHDYPVTKYEVKQHVIGFGYCINKTDTIAESNDIQQAHIQYINNNITINQNLTILNAETPSLNTVCPPIETTYQPYSNPVIDHQKTINNEDGTLYVAYRRKNKCKEDIDTLYFFMLHYLEPFLDENGKVVLRDNLVQFFTKRKPQLSPVPLAKNITYHKFDILHICYAVGHHTQIWHLAEEIAEFAKACFPKSFEGNTSKYLRKRLKNTDPNSLVIPVIEPLEQLPKYYPKENKT